MMLFVYIWKVSGGGLHIAFGFCPDAHREQFSAVQIGQIDEFEKLGDLVLTNTPETAIMNTLHILLCEYQKQSTIYSVQLETKRS